MGRTYFPGVSYPSFTGIIDSDALGNKGVSLFAPCGAPKTTGHTMWPSRFPGASCKLVWKLFVLYAGPFQPAPSGTPL